MPVAEGKFSIRKALHALRRFWCEGEGFYKNIFCEGEAAFFGCDRAAEGRRTAAQGGGSSAEVARLNRT